MASGAATLSCQGGTCGGVRGAAPGWPIHFPALAGVREGVRRERLPAVDAGVCGTERGARVVSVVRGAAPGWPIHFPALDLGNRGGTLYSGGVTEGAVLKVERAARGVCVAREDAVRLQVNFPRSTWVAGGHVVLGRGH